MNVTFVHYFKLRTKHLDCASNPIGSNRPCPAGPPWLNLSSTSRHCPEDTLTDCLTPASTRPAIIAVAIAVPDNVPTIERKNRESPCFAPMTIRVFIFHRRERRIVAQIKKSLEVGTSEPVVSIERQANAISLAENACEDLRMIVRQKLLLLIVEQFSIDECYDRSRFGSCAPGHDGPNWPLVWRPAEVANIPRAGGQRGWIDPQNRRYI